MFQAFSTSLSALAPASQLQTALELRPISSVGQVRADLSYFKEGFGVWDSNPRLL